MRSHGFSGLKAFATAAAAVLLSSCIHTYVDVTEGDGDGVDPTEINFTINLTTGPLLRSTSVQPKSSPISDYVIFVVEFYEDEFAGEPVARRETVVPREASGLATGSVSAPLHSGRYRIAAFAAGCDDPQGGGCPYDMTSLSAVTYSGTEYFGSSDKKECHDGRFDITLPETGWFSNFTISASLSSPVGRLEIVSNDAGAFAKHEGQEGADDAFWEDYTVSWEYVLYFPISYNVLTGLPNRAVEGIGFTSDLTRLSDDDVLLGYDYIFVNGSQTTIGVTLRVYDKHSGELLSTYGYLSAEMDRAATTTIRGQFLTTENDSGIGINPDFDGTIDVVLPDQ